MWTCQENISTPLKHQQQQPGVVIWSRLAMRILTCYLQPKQEWRFIVSGFSSPVSCHLLQSLIWNGLLLPDFISRFLFSCFSSHLQKAVHWISAAFLSAPSSLTSVPLLSKSFPHWIVLVFHHSEKTLGTLMVKNPEDQQLPKHSDQLPDTTVHTSDVDSDEAHNQQQLADCIAALFPLTSTILSLVRYSIHFY